MEFGCNVGDTLFIVSLEKRKIYKFDVDCLKLFEHNFTAHGYIYGTLGAWGIPKEFSLKNLNKRIIFSDKKMAKEWLKKHLN